MHLSLNFTPKQRNSDYLLHGRWEIGGSVGTANKKQVFFIRVGAKLMGRSLYEKHKKNNDALSWC